MTPFLPYQRDPIAGSLTAPNVWYTFFSDLRDFIAASGLDVGVIDQILARLDELEENQPGQFVIQGLLSVEVDGMPQNGIVQVHLLNDSDAPGNTYTYGTGPDGTKGWFAVADAVAGADSVVQTVGADGVSTFNLDGDVASPGLGYTYATHLSTGDKGWFRPALFESTGVLMGGALSINAGDNTKFDIAQAIIGSTDYTAGAANPQRAISLFGPSLANAVPSLAVIATYVGIQMPSGTLTMQSSPFTAAQTRTIAPLGAVISNGVNLIAVNNLPGVMRAGINQIQDLMAAIGPMNLSGNVISANGAGLDLSKSAGVVFKQGSNFVTDPNNPHGLTLPALTGFAFNYRLSTGTQFASTTVVDPNNYESPLGTLAVIPAANRFTIQRFTVFTSNLVRAQYGQHVYNTMAEAEASLSTEAFATEANIAENGILLAFLIVQDGATDLADPTQAKFIPASKFGGPVGTGGTSITNTDSLPEGVVNLYFTDARARAAVVTASITNGDTTHSPSGDAVFDALALKADSSAVVHLAGTETVTGAKTFTSAVSINNMVLSEAAGAGSIVVNRVAGAVNVNTDPMPLDGSSVALARYFRSTNTTGQVALQVLQGNNTSTVNHTIAGNGLSTMCRVVGNLVIGNTGDNGVGKLQVSGTLTPFANNTSDNGTAALRWATSYTVNLNQSGARFETGVVSPAQLTANTDNWAITGLSTAAIVRASTDASRNLTGIASPTAGQMLLLINVGTQDLVLVHDATSTAANRFLLPNSANLTLNPNDSVRLWYDSTSSRWRVQGT